MAQLVMPIFPAGSSHITPSLVFEKRDGKVFYFHGCIPVFSHAEEDIRSFRMFTSQLIANGTCKQVDVIRAFGVPAISVKRALKLFREQGASAFYEVRKRTRTPRVMTSTVIEKAQSLLDNGSSRSTVAEELGIKRETIRHAIRDGRLVERRQTEKKTKANET